MTGGDDAGPVRIAVIGCGAIGSLYAAHLARVPGVEVWAMDRWTEHVDAIESRGLRVTGLADFAANVHARTDGRDLPACDFGLVATKALQTRAAVESARSALANAAVVSVQNGLGNEEVIAELVPRVIRGSIVTAGSIMAPGVVRYDAPGDSWFGPFESQPAPMDEIVRLARLLTEGGLRTHALEDARGPAVDESHFQFRDESAGRADRVVGGPRLHRRRAAPAGRRAGHRGGGGLRAGRDRAGASAAGGGGRGHRRSI
jgi:2-dehydropantoate 2-reductase